MKILDIAPQRLKRREFTRALANTGHEVLTVPGRQEALAQLKRGPFDLALLDATTELYDAPTFAAELRAKAKGELMIAVLVEPRHRPPRHRMTGSTEDVIVLQEGTVDHMIGLLHLALSVRAATATP